MNTLVLRPRLSEKVYKQTEELNTYVFVVPAKTNSQQVAKAVAEQFKVTVTAVRVASSAGKTRRAYRRRGYTKPRRQPDIKKAYVTLKEGDSLPIFAEESKTETKKETK